MARDELYLNGADVIKQEIWSDCKLWNNHCSCKSCPKGVVKEKTIFLLQIYRYFNKIKNVDFTTEVIAEPSLCLSTLHCLGLLVLGVWDTTWDRRASEQPSLEQTTTLPCRFPDRLLLLPLEGMYCCKKLLPFLWLKWLTIWSSEQWRREGQILNNGKSISMLWELGNKCRHTWIFLQSHLKIKHQTYLI